MHRRTISARNHDCQVRVSLIEREQMYGNELLQHAQCTRNCHPFLLRQTSGRQIVAGKYASALFCNGQTLGFSFIEYGGVVSSLELFFMVQCHDGQP